MAAMNSYKTGGGLSNFEDRDYTTLLHQLYPVYKILSVQLFSTRLLDKTYCTLQGKLQVIVDKYMYFNYMTDESWNKQRDRIVILSVESEIETFQLESQIILFINHIACELARWTDEWANFWSRGAITNHNPWATDTA